MLCVFLYIHFGCWEFDEPVRFLTNDALVVTQDLLFRPKMFRRWQLEVDCRGIMGTTLEVEEEGTTTYVNTAADENQPELGPSTSR